MAVHLCSGAVVDRPACSALEYVRAGGGEGLRRALEMAPARVVEEVRRSGLRGRGGAGFPTGVKWEAVRADPCPTKFVVANGAEGEPGTFKDRWLLRRNPYQVLEGLAIAAHAVGAWSAFVALKASFGPELAAVRRALEELPGAGVDLPVPVHVVAGPDRYLFGEEKALLEVIEGNPPLPRILPPYLVGLYAGPGSANPTVVNNVETLANVPHILREGADRFRSLGTAASPGTMVFTLSGDVEAPGMYELPLGVPLRSLVFDLGGGPREGRRVKAVFSGASHGILTADLLDTPLDFDAMRRAGSGLGSGGFVVYDDSACVVGSTRSHSRFLALESCGQCPACAHGTEEITEALDRLERGEGSADDLRRLAARTRTVTGGQRCALPSGEAAMVGSLLERFGAEVREHLGRPCPRPRPLPDLTIVDFDEATGRFEYATPRPGDPTPASAGEGLRV